MKTLFLILGFLCGVQAELYDVTTIHRLDEAITTTREAYFPSCYAGGDCSDWEVANGFQHTDSNVHGVIFPSTERKEFTYTDDKDPLPTTKLSAGVIGVAISKRNRYSDILFVFSPQSQLDFKSDLLVMNISSNSRKLVYRCLQDQDGVELWIGSQVRRCSAISFKDITKEVYTDEQYHVHWSPETLTIISSQDQQTMFEVKHIVQLQDIRTMTVLVKGKVTFNPPSNVFSLTASKSSLSTTSTYYGTPTMPPAGACIAITVYLDPRSGASVTVSVEAEGNTEKLGVISAAKNDDMKERMKKVAETWMFATTTVDVANASYGSRWFRIKVMADRLHDYPVLIGGIVPCESYKGAPVNTLMLSKRSSTEIHSRTNARGLPFRLDNGTLSDPSVGVDVPTFTLGASSGWQMTNWTSTSIFTRSTHRPSYAPLNIGESDSQQGYPLILQWNSHSNPTEPREFGGSIEFNLNFRGHYNSGQTFSVILQSFLRIRVAREIITIKFGSYYNSATVVIERCGIDVNEGGYSSDDSQAHDSDIYCTQKKQVDLPREPDNSDLFRIIVAGKKIILLSGEIEIISWTDLKPIEASYYRLSYGGTQPSVVIHSPTCISLNEETGTLLSAALYPRNSQLCVVVDYISDDEGAIEVMAVDSAGQSIGNTTREAHELRHLPGPDLWERAMFVTKLPSTSKSSAIQLLLQAHKSTDDQQAKIVIQRVGGCNAEDAEDIVILPSRPKLIIRSSDRGLNVAANDQEKMLSEIPCANGGLQVHDSPGKCACSAGFTGTNCERACGANRYGDDCAGVCSETDRECSGMWLCRPLLGCDCGPGLTGPFCNTPCSAGYYGAGCKQRCGSCVVDGGSDSATCDRYTGACNLGCDSTSGLFPPLCHDKYTHLSTAPLAVFDNSSVLSVSFPLATQGKGVPAYYQIQVRELINPPTEKWLKMTPKVILVSETSVKDNVPNLQRGLQYQVRIVLLDKDGNSYQGDDIPVAETKSSCTVPDMIEYHLTAEGVDSNRSWVTWKYSPGKGNWCSPTEYEVHVKQGWRWVVNNVKVSSEWPKEETFLLEHLLPGRQYKVKVRAITHQGPASFSDTILLTTLQAAESGPVEDLQVLLASGGNRLHVTWKRPSNVLSSSDVTYAVSYTCVELLACPGADCSHSSGVLDTSKLDEYVEGLLPFARYRISVNAGSMGLRSTVYAATEPSVPAVAPRQSDDFIISRTNISLAVRWEPPSECSSLNGYQIGYHYQLIHPGQSAPCVEENTSEPGAVFRNLEPHTKYVVKVYVATTNGWNKNYALLLPVKTRATTPDSVTQLTVYKRGRRMLGLRWGPPSHMYGLLRSFSVAYRPTDGSTMQTTILATPCPTWPDLYCHTLKGLSPDLEYSISVRARNVEVEEDGDEASVSAITKEQAPSAPSFIKLVNQTTSSVTVAWGLPDPLNGALRSFLVNVEETDSHNATDCCQAYNMKNIQVTSESPEYVYEITDLRAASTYLVSVNGKTVSLGPSVSITANTRPPIPSFLQPPQVMRRSDGTLVVNASSVDAYTDMVSGYLLLIAVNEASTTNVALDTILDPWLKNELKQINQTMHLAAEYTQDTVEWQGDSFLLDIQLNNTARQGLFGTLYAPDIPVGIPYQLVQVAVLDYNGSRSIAYSRSQEV